MNSEGITVTRIEAVNVLKFDRFELDNPTKLTLVRGGNNRGKTTVLRLLGLCVAGSDDPARVIHDGASKGTITLGLSDGYVLRRSFTERGEYFDILDEKGHKVPSPQKFINDRLGEYRDFNPLAWLAMDPKEQVRVLLQAIDVRLEAEEFKAATRCELPIPLTGMHGLLALDALRTHYAEERRVENRLADQKKKAALEARATLPAERPVIAEERRAIADVAVNEARRIRESIEARRLAATNHAAAVERIEKSKQRERDDDERDRAEIADLETRIGQIRDRQQRRMILLAELDEELAALATSAPPSEEERAAANEKIREANALAQSIAADEKTLERFAAVAALEQEAADAAAQASVIDATIKTIDGELRALLMKKAALPVESLTIEDGRILVGGHELGFLAESQRMRIAVAIARALRPALRVIVLDGTEQLDAETFALFLDEIRGDGFTYIASEVVRDGGALEIVQFGENSDGLFVAGEKEVA